MAHMDILHFILSCLSYLSTTLSKKILISSCFFLCHWPKEIVDCLPHSTPKKKNFPSISNTYWHGACLLEVRMFKSLEDKTIKKYHQNKSTPIASKKHPPCYIFPWNINLPWCVVNKKQFACTKHNEKWMNVFHGETID